MNADSITTSNDAHEGKTHRPIRGHCFVEAERHIAMAANLIEEGRSHSATGAIKTCSLLLDLLAGVNTPLRRLGRISELTSRNHPTAELDMTPPSFVVEAKEVGR